jgi:hypothetical protein
MLFSQCNRAGWRVAIGLRTLLIGLFFLASHPQVFDPLGDYSPLRESRLVSPKEYIESAALSWGFKSNGGQGEESFLTAAVHHHVQVERASILHVNHKLGLHSPTLIGSFLIRSPPANLGA